MQLQCSSSACSSKSTRGKRCVRFPSLFICHAFLVCHLTPLQFSWTVPLAADVSSSLQSMQSQSFLRCIQFSPRDAQSRRFPSRSPAILLFLFLLLLLSLTLLSFLFLSVALLAAESWQKSCTIV